MGPNAELNIASAAILVLVFIYATLGYRARQTRRYRLFAALSSATCLAVVAGLARSIIVSCLGEGADAATAPLRAAVIVFQCIAANLLFSYTAVLCRGDAPLRRERIVTTSIPCALAIVATATTFATGAVIGVDDAGAVTSGSLYLAVHVCIAFYPLSCLVYSIVHRRMLRTLDRSSSWRASPSRWRRACSTPSRSG